MIAGAACAVALAVLCAVLQLAPRESTHHAADDVPSAVGHDRTEPLAALVTSRPAAQSVALVARDRGSRLPRWCVVAAIMGMFAMAAAAGRRRPTQQIRLGSTTSRASVRRRGPPAAL